MGGIFDPTGSVFGKIPINIITSSWPIKCGRCPRLYYRDLWCSLRRSLARRKAWVRVHRDVGCRLAKILPPCIHHSTKLHNIEISYCSMAAVLATFMPAEIFPHPIWESSKCWPLERFTWVQECAPPHLAHQYCKSIYLFLFVPLCIHFNLC